jgi:starch-binding outer membrane protein, SusD/RagB family
MKKINKLTQAIAALFCVGFMAACTDLATKEVDSRIVTTTGGGKTNAKAGDLLQAAYNDLQAFTDQANIYALYEHVTDELIPPTRGVDWSDNGVWRSLYTHTWDASHSWVLGAWNTLNQNAFRASIILDAGDVTAQQKAEAKFIRAWNTFFIMDLFGQVPLRNTSDGPTVLPKVRTRMEAFADIEKDLTEALADLPGSGPFTKDGAPNPTATKAAANTLLARMYLNKAVYSSATGVGPYTFAKADMDKVVGYCKAVTDAGYGLTANYFDSFKKGGSSEVILSSQQGSPQNRVYMTLHYGQKPSGWNGFATLADFYAKFESGDKRRGSPPNPTGADYSGLGRGFLVGQQVDDNGKNLTDSRTSLPLSFTGEIPLSGAPTGSGIRVLKYHPIDYDKYIMLRYGEVLTMQAEALLRSGDATGATTLVNTLRANRGATALAGTLDLAKMLDERGRELYWEGIRKMDLIRFEKFNDDWAEKGTNKDAFRVLYCIPQQALDSNPGLKQNPGY